MKMREQSVQIAAAVIANRADDKTTVPDIYRPVTTAGVWIPTTPPITAQYAQAKPWALIDRTSSARSATATD
jgi:hypothetical protein